MNLEVSIIIPTYNEEKHIQKCIQSLLDQDFKKNYDIIIADGMSTDKTRKIIKEFQKKNKNVVLLDNKEQRQAQGRNLAINYSKAKFISYIDGHSYAKKDWLRNLHSAFFEMEKKDKKTIGIGSIHLDANNTKFSRASTIAFNSYIGGGNSSFKQTKKLEKVRTAYACLFERKKLDKVGHYNPKFIKGQDLELNMRMTKKYNLYVNPKAITYYYKRDNFSKLFKQMLRYGFWRYKVMKHIKETNIILFIPSLITIYFLLGLFIWLTPFFNMWIIGILFYIILVLFQSIYSSFKNKEFICYLPIIYLMIHLGYGLGMIKSLFMKLDNIQDR